MIADEMQGSALLGRVDGLARLRDLVGGVRLRQGAAITIVGAPGVGKTALLRSTAAEGVRTIDVTGAESEVELPWAGLASLLEPLREHASALTATEQGTLRGAFALEQQTVADTAPVLQAAVGLLAAAGAREPLLLRVDDVQWLDPSSRQAIAFVARRAVVIGIGVIAVWSQRGVQYDPWPGVGVLTLEELGRVDALALARRAGLAPAVAEALVAAVGGNPLALIEGPEQLSPAERDGHAHLPTVLPVGPRLETAYARRLEALPPATRAALLVAALSADGATAPLRAALGGLDVLAPAEDLGMIAVDARGLSFAHPIVRTAIDRAAMPSARRAAHRVLAEVVDAPQRAWHLAAAAQAPDEALATALEGLGHDAAQRGAPATAATALARAAELSPDRARAIGRTVAAATMALTAGSPDRAVALLDTVLAEARESGLRADVQLLRGTAIQQAGSPMAAFALLEAEAARVVGHDRARAAGLLTQAGLALVASGPVDRVAATAERAVDLAPAGAELLPAVLQASVLAPLGQHDRARSLLREHRVRLQGVDPAGPGHEVLAVAALVHVWMEDYEDAERLLAWYVEGCRKQGAVVALAVPLSIWARLHLRRGCLTDAARLSEEAVALGEVAAGSFVHAATLSTAALVAANLGEAEACVRHAEQASAIALRLDLTSTLASVEQTLGFLALGAADVATAIVHLERARDHTRRFGAVDPSFLYTHADLAEAYARAGRPADAATVIDELASGAEMTGGAWAAAATARCRLLVEGDDRLDDHIATALAAHARLAQPFELARTQLCAGERLRRARRRVDARAQLTAAHAAFAAVSAERWAERAAHELRAAGGRRSGPSPSEAMLTAREADVCALVAAGATNREVAARLYLSPRTVEHHLRTAYRKLGVRSRTEMMGRFT